MKKGKLIRVEISPGRFVKMYESDVKKETKIAKKPTENKGALTPVNPDPVEVVSDTLADIPGIGKATERSLNDHGIYTFDQLFIAGELPFLTDKSNQKIEDWREGHRDD